jgi:predicted nucleic-acid-binding protein
VTRDRIAVDTNIVVRFLVNDDAAQAARARALIAANPVFIAVTVLLETEWVLRAAYGFASADIARFLRALLGLAEVRISDPEAIAQALSAYEAGLDFADALHLSLLGEAGSFATFDRRFAKKARSLQPRPILVP